ncbi:MAG TPA: serine/threonine-protein kinase, partial [Gemmata sp.]|nr:serine/threonine-protein kinase [Gemmata sp.]
MGTVFRARDRQTGANVAIKVVKATLAENPMLHHRLAQEFRAATQLEHPNIVRAIEIDTDGSTSYLVFELVEGEDLGQRIENCGRLPEEEAVRIVTQIAQALHYAHQRQVIHRDVKPDNILVTPDGRAKLTDFGLAKDYNNDLDLTRHASGLGTPHFMAPEQFASAKTATVRCDVYSLGATLYNALTGELPFRAKFGLAILANKEKDPPSVRKLVPEISHRVDDAIRCALQKD